MKPTMINPYIPATPGSTFFNFLLKNNLLNNTYQVFRIILLNIELIKIFIMKYYPNLYTKNMFNQNLKYTYDFSCYSYI